MSHLSSKSLWISLFVSILSALPAAALGDAWMTDIVAAREKAEAEGKSLLLYFTGSEWCPPCITLDREVFTQDAFLSYAKEALVLVEFDFPRPKPPVFGPKAEKDAIAERYEIEYFPTVVLLSPDGDILGRTGYMPGGPNEYIAHLKSYLE